MEEKNSFYENKKMNTHIQIISDNFDRKIYDRIACHPLQSWAWGEARKKMGIEVLRIGEFDEENLINVFQITFHQMPYTPFKIGYLPRSHMPSEEILRFLADEGRKRKCIFIKIEPYAEKNTDATEGVNTISPRGCTLIKSLHPLFPDWTILLDLTQSENELLAHMRSKTRYNIRLAETKGVTVKEMTHKEGFDIFAKLYFDTCKKQRYFGHTCTYHNTVFETLRDTTAHILIAFYKDTPLAAYEIFIFNDVLYYPYGGSSDTHRNLMASNLLMWETIKFGKQRGAKRFDMWGSLPPHYDINNPWSGFTRFKQGYGGEFVEMIGSYDLVMNSYLYKFYHILYILRHQLLTFHF